MAALELVIVLPMMFLLMLGGSEVYMYMRAVSNVEHTAFMLADSIGQMSQVVDSTTTSSPNTLGSIWASAALLAAPLNLTTNGAVFVTSVCDATTTPCGTVAPVAMSMAAGTPKIYWQRSATWNVSGLTTNESASAVLPSTWPFRNGDSAVVVEVQYQYNPFAMTKAFWKNAPGTQTISQRIYVRPRTGVALPLASS